MFSGAIRVIRGNVKLLWACGIVPCSAVNPWCHNHRTHYTHVVGLPRRGQRDATARDHLLVSVRAWRLGCLGSGPTSATAGCSTGRVTLKLPSPGPRQMLEPEQGKVKRDRFFKVIPITVPTKRLDQVQKGSEKQTTTPPCLQQTHSRREGTEPLLLSRTTPCRAGCRLPPTLPRSPRNS